MAVAKLRARRRSDPNKTSTLSPGTVMCSNPSSLPTRWASVTLAHKSCHSDNLVYISTYITPADNKPPRLSTALDRSFAVVGSCLTSSVGPAGHCPHSESASLRSRVSGRDGTVEPRLCALHTSEIPLKACGHHVQGIANKEKKRPWWQKTDVLPWDTFHLILHMQSMGG
ncbi:hypothetical protein BX600DRAFT_450761 [Xylariales sp. PMI_506]|nr:hypothetical protein BX600DRAFT_450761 [Xylariales sp. PMI_506]